MRGARAGARKPLRSGSAELKVVVALDSGSVYR